MMNSRQTPGRAARIDFSAGRRDRLPCGGEERPELVIADVVEPWK